MSHPAIVTVDAETEVIRPGIEAIANVRSAAEDRTGTRIPITWFVRFQRSWSAYVGASDTAAVSGRVRDGFDGFELAEDVLGGLRERGDELAWHYHAYNWVERPDLARATRLEILRADLAACAEELRARHPQHAVASFRFGWFFVPHPSVYALLAELGIANDASVDPQRAGRTVVPGRPARHAATLATRPQTRDGVRVLPRRNTVLTHDWSVVPHDLGWTRLDEAGAALARAELEDELVAAAAAGRAMTVAEAAEPVTAGA